VTIRSIDALPRTPTMKIAKGALAEFLGGFDAH
jgi:acyl-coenzyme A synthetase/AMP-(fatty) acid ligase